MNSALAVRSRLLGEPEDDFRTPRPAERTPRRPWLTWLGFLLALPIVVLSVIAAVSPSPRLLVWTAALESLFYFYATGSLIAYMLQDWVATTDELFAAGATFTLLAWAFAYAYVVCDAIFPGSFAAADGAAAPCPRACPCPCRPGCPA